MSRLAVDSSVVIKWFVEEPYSSEARRILEVYENGSLSLIAPDPLYAEVGNIVWKKQAFQGLQAEDAQSILKLFRQLRIELVSGQELLPQAHEFAVTHKRSVYDMFYVALAVREKTAFVTAYEKLFNAVEAHFHNVVWLLNWSSAE